MPQVISGKGRVISVNQLIFGNKAMMKRYGYHPLIPDRLRWTGKRMVASGALGPQSKGGIYNPGLVKHGTGYSGTIRVEANYLAYTGRLFDMPCQCAFWSFDKDFNSTGYRLLQPPVYEARTRIEDFRMFEYQGRFLCDHVGIEITNPKLPLQFLSEVDLNTGALNHIHKFNSPNGMPEKNWGWFVSGGKIMLLYLLSSRWIIMEYDEETHRLTEVVNVPFQISWLAGSMASVSSLPVAYGDDFLVWYHSRVDGFYHHSAVIFDGKTFEPKYWYDDTIFHGGHTDGRHPFALYISSCVIEDDRLLLFYGEGDSHASVMVVDRKEFEELVMEGNGLNC